MRLLKNNYVALSVFFLSRWVLVASCLASCNTRSSSSFRSFLAACCACVFLLLHPEQDLPLLVALIITGTSSFFLFICSLLLPAAAPGHTLPACPAPAAFYPRLLLFYPSLRRRTRLIGTILPPLPPKARLLKNSSGSS